MVETKTKSLNSSGNSIKLWRNYALLFIAVLMPFYPKFMTIPIVINLLFWIFEKKDRNVLKNLVANKSSLFLACFFLLHIIGLLWTSNFSFAGLDLQIKLPLLIFPLILVTTSWPNADLRLKIYKYFNLSMVVAIIICMLRALFSYFTKGPNYFFYKDFSYFLHPGYFSMFLCFGSVLLLNDLYFTDTAKRLIKSSIHIWNMLILFTFAIVLLASKAGIFVQIVLLFTGLILMLKENSFKPSKHISGLALIFIGLIYFGLFSPLTAARMNELKTAVSATQTQEVHSSGERLQAWQSAMELIRQSPLLGTGTGDVKDELVKRYEVNGFMEIFNLRLNAHNQFLQSFVALGFLGFLFLILVFYFATVCSIKSRNIVLAGFLFIAVFNMMIEAVLEVTAGTVFFGFFLTLLVYGNANSKIESNGTN